MLLSIYATNHEQPCADNDPSQMYRCWVIYNRSWRILVLPILLWLACLVTLILIAQGCTKTTQLVISPIIFISCHIVNNIYGTSAFLYHATQRSVLILRPAAIAYTIIRVAQTNSDNSRRLKKTARIFVESGLLYTVSGVLDLAFQTSSNIRINYVFLGCTTDIFVCSPLLYS